MAEVIIEYQAAEITLDTDPNWILSRTGVCFNDVTSISESEAEAVTG